MPEDGNSKKQKHLFIIAAIILLLTVVGASYAYFAVTTVNNFGTSTINAQAGNIGTVTLNGNSAQLNIGLTALDMVQGNDDITYYASSSGKTIIPPDGIIATAEVTPSTDTNYYHCTYTLNVTHTGTNDMYTAFTNGANKSSDQIILTINGTDYDFNDGWPTNNQVSGEFYITGGQTRNIIARLRIINDSSINQNYLANTDISISISLVNNSLSCTAVDYMARNGTDTTTGLPIIRIGGEEFYDITSAIDYSTLISTNGNIYNYASNKSILLAKYNLLVGDSYYYGRVSPRKLESLSSNNTVGYGLQSELAKGYSNPDIYIGTVGFSGIGYWDNADCVWAGPQSNTHTCAGTAGLKTEYANTSNLSGATGNYSTTYPYAYKSTMSSIAPLYVQVTGGDYCRVQNNGYTIAYYVEEYVQTLKNISSLNNIEGRLLTYEEAYDLPNTIRSGPAYWLGSVRSSSSALGYVGSVNRFSGLIFYNASLFGVRPVIIMSTSDIAS